MVGVAEGSPLRRSASPSAVICAQLLLGFGSTSPSKQVLLAACAAAAAYGGASSSFTLVDSQSLMQAYEAFLGVRNLIVHFSYLSLFQRLLPRQGGAEQAESLPCASGALQQSVLSLHDEKEVTERSSD